MLRGAGGGSSAEYESGITRGADEQPASREPRKSAASPLTATPRIALPFGRNAGQAFVGCRDTSYVFVDFSGTLSLWCHATALLRYSRASFSTDVPNLWTKDRARARTRPERQPLLDVACADLSSWPQGARPRSGLPVARSCLLIRAGRRGKVLAAGELVAFDVPGLRLVEELFRELRATLKRFASLVTCIKRAEITSGLRPRA
jgi:hypothetical protein